MKKIIIILLCLSLLGLAAPLFAAGRDHNAHRWHRSSVHPAFHGWRGWGQAPRRAPDGVPAEAPENPPDGPKVDPGDKPVEKPGEKPGDTVLLPAGMLELDPRTGGFSG